MPENFYETDEAVTQYVFFHYGEPDEFLPYPDGPGRALAYPVRAVTEMVDCSSLDSKSRALDLGCAVGASSFELSKVCGEVIGMDLASRLIEAANRMKSDGKMDIAYSVEGDHTQKTTCRVDESAQPDRVQFQVGDAQALSLGLFDVILMVNLIDRLPDPEACLRTIPSFLKPEGQLIVLSPYTWLEEYTPREKWLSSTGRTTHEALIEILQPTLTLTATKNLPFLIREHARKFQWSVAEGTHWIASA